MATWRAENSMLTQRGIEILNKVKSGVGLVTITRVVAGSGRVPASTLFTQSEVKGIQKDMIISYKNADDEGSEIGIYITNDDFNDSFPLNQIGIYVVHPDYEGEQLYHISQCEEEGADVIPSYSDNPTTQGYSIYMEHSNESFVEITVNAQGMVSKDEFNSTLSNYVIGLKSSTTRYVDSTNGSDFTGDGSELNPFASIQKAIDSIPTNLNGKAANILVRPGEYAKFTLTHKYNGYIAIVGTDQSNMPVIKGDCVVGFCYGRVDFEFLKFTSDLSGTGVIGIYSTQEIRISTCTIDAVSKTSSSGIHVQSGGVNLGLTTCIFKNCNYCVNTSHSSGVGGNSSISVYTCTGSNNNYGFLNNFALLVLYRTSQANMGCTTMYRNIETSGPTYADGIHVSSTVAPATLE